MDMFCFASRNEENIRIGFDQKLWAVAPTEHMPFFDGMITKSKKLQPGAKGLLYCKKYQEFTTPFEITSKVEHHPERVQVRNVWPNETWWFPFEMKPLGHWSKTIHAEIAKEIWPFLRNGLRPIVSPATVFNRIQITAEQWTSILHELGDGK